MTVTTWLWILRVLRDVFAIHLAMDTYVILHMSHCGPFCFWPVEGYVEYTRATKKYDLY